MILKLLWIKWNIQKTYFWSYFWINIIFKIIFVTLFWVPPLPDAEEFDSPPKKFLPCLWKFSIPPLPLKIPKFLSDPQSRVGKHSSDPPFLKGGLEFLKIDYLLPTNIVGVGPRARSARKTFRGFAEI